MQRVLLFCLAWVHLSAYPDGFFEAVGPYLIGEEHPAKRFLDQKLSEERATASSLALREGGFLPIVTTHRGTTIVRHPELPGYLLKVILDSKAESVLAGIPRGPDEFLEFVGRCRKRDACARVIADKNLMLFEVPRKWIYLIPEVVDPPPGADYVKKFCLLVVEDMGLIDSQENLDRWYGGMTRETLSQLFALITELHLHDAHPGNVAFTIRGTLAVVDTKEWPESIMRVKRPIPFLNRDGQKYWKRLMKKDGYSDSP